MVKKVLLIGIHLVVGISNGLAGSAATADDNDDGADAAKREYDGYDDGDGVGTLLGGGESVVEVAVFRRIVSGRVAEFARSS